MHSKQNDMKNFFRPKFSFILLYWDTYIIGIDKERKIWYISIYLVLVELQDLTDLEKKET